MRLVNGRGEWVARFAAQAPNLSKRGVLEIVSWEVSGGSLDEVVVSGIAVVEMAHRKK